VLEGGVECSPAVPYLEVVNEYTVLLEIRTQVPTLVSFSKVADQAFRNAASIKNAQQLAFSASAILRSPSRLFYFAM
jgi:hypothetical protein